MGAVGVGVHEAHGYGIYLVGFQRPDGHVQRTAVQQLLQDVPVPVHPLVDRQPQVTRHHRRRRLVLVVEGLLLDAPAHLQCVTGAPGGDEPGAATAAGEDRVGGHGGAMDQEGRGAQERAQVGVALLRHFSDTAQDGPGEIARVGRNLVEDQLVVAIPEREVDKGSANVHSHAVRVLRFVHGGVGRRGRERAFCVTYGLSVRKSSLNPLKIAVKYEALPWASANNALAKPFTMRGVAGAIPPVGKTASPEPAVDSLNGPVRVRHRHAFVRFEGAVRVEARGRQMDLVVPGMGPQLKRFRRECLERTGKVKALYFDVPFAADTAADGAGGEIRLEGDGGRKLLRRDPALRISPLVAVSVQIPAARTAGVRRRTLYP